MNPTMSAPPAHTTTRMPSCQIAVASTRRRSGLRAAAITISSERAWSMSLLMSVLHPRRAGRLGGGAQLSIEGRREAARDDGAVEPRLHGAGLGVDAAAGGAPEA